MYTAYTRRSQTVGMKSRGRVQLDSYYTVLVLDLLERSSAWTYSNTVPAHFSVHIRVEFLTVPTFTEVREVDVP